MTYSQQDGARDRHIERAGIFIDYENLYGTLVRSTQDGVSPSGVISKMIEALQRSLLEDRHAQTAVMRAYADFEAIERTGESVQRALSLQGVETHFVARGKVYDATELQLGVDAMDYLHHRTDVTTFVLLTGRRIYLPLVRMFRRYGREVLVFGLGEPAALEEVPQLDGEWFFPAGGLLGEPAVRRAVEDVSRSRSASTADADDIDDPVLIRTLEIIDEHFGQYQEVYLTPLLRKLSELLDERRYDPKNLISELQDYGAVRLEKRQGFPHDYTVLILEYEHPAVERVLEASQRGASYGENGRALHDDGDARYRANGHDGAYHDAYTSDDNLHDDYRRVEDALGDDDYDDGFDDGFDAEFDDDYDYDDDDDLTEDIEEADPSGAAA